MSETPRGLPTVAAPASRSVVDRVRAWPLWAKIAVPVVLVFLIAAIAGAGAGSSSKSGATSALPTATSSLATTTTTSPTQPVGLADPGDTKNCSDFADYSEAKAWYDTYFPAYGDVAGIDADSDGIPCESLAGAPG